VELEGTELPSENSSSLLPLKGPELMRSTQDQKHKKRKFPLIIPIIDE